MGLNNRDENYKTSEIDKDQWSDLTDKERDLVIAKKVLTILKKQEEFLQRQTDVGNTNPEASDSHTINLTGSTEDGSTMHSDIPPVVPPSRLQQGQSLPHVHTDSTTETPTDVGKINLEVSDSPGSAEDGSTMHGDSQLHVHTDSTTPRPTDVGKINPGASPLQISNAEEPNSDNRKK